MVRIPGFHPGGPGSIPGVGIPFCIFFFFVVVVVNLFFFFFFFCIIGTNLTVIISESSNEIVDEQMLSLDHLLRQNPKIVGIGKIHMVSVPRWKPITRKQFDTAVKYWPTHFHEDKR